MEEKSWLKGEDDFERERLERRTKQEEIDSGEEKADDAEDDKGSIFCLLYYTVSA